jgi:2-dehydro-3-deoxyphosphooctonate aldolase (KDO 8-P synthase)
MKTIQVGQVGQVGPVKIGGTQPLVLIAGPCAIERRAQVLRIAEKVQAIAAEAGVGLIFKASYDKANRTSGSGYRGPGIEAGLEVLAEVKARFGVPILTDVHTPEEARQAAAVADVLQLPAFLCRQTDLVLALGETRKVVNIKKGQFLAPWDVKHIIEKVESTGNRKILLTERGSSFGYNNLVADMRSLAVMRGFGYPVIFDATHSVQLPGAGDGGTGGEACWAPHLARAAVATGCDGVFIETHPQPAKAKSDKDTMLRLAELPALVRMLKAIDDLVDGRSTV